MLDVAGLSRGTAVRDATFQLRKGEVLGVSGLVGAGRTELLRLIAGVDRPTAGEIRVEGKALRTGDPRAAISAGLGLLPEERKRDGILARRSITSNIGLSSMRRFSRLGFIRKRALRAESEKLMREMNLRPMMIDRPIGQFSGGNQQKAIIGRWIAAGARILLFDEPTRGIDVGAKAEIYSLIERLAAEGRSVIVVSSEMPEILRVSDRVLVMREGRVVAALEREDLSEETLVAHAIPQSRDAQSAPQTGKS
jgi:ribose transport system ATP-binding protein